MNELPDYQTIEDAYKGVAEVIEKLPDDNWTARARDHLGMSEQATYQARERAQESAQGEG